MHNATITKEYKGINNITSLIHVVRGKPIILDCDLAKVYGCQEKAKEINKIIKKNIQEFPVRFAFNIKKEELKKIQTKKKKYLAFTEQGVIMLATHLKEPVKKDILISIIDAFVLVRNNLNKGKKLSNQVFKNTQRIKNLQDSLKKLEIKTKNNEIYFNGQIYDAYSKIVDIFKMAKEELVIVDGYADKVLLDMIRDIKAKVKIICKKNMCLKKLDIEKYQKQYHNLEVRYDNTYHDRYFIIDNQIIYHCGTSINHIGCKTFSINLLEDKDIVKSLLNKISIKK